MAARRAYWRFVWILHKGKANIYRVLLGVQYMREEMESISRTDRIWMSSMKTCRKYCGCHQMPERSFFIGGYQLPLCARCTGILAGHVIGMVVSLFWDVSLLSLIGTIPLMIDGTVQQFTSYESTNHRRLFTGILYGFGMMSACIHAVRRIVKISHS